MPSNNPNINSNDPIVGSDGKVTRNWYNFFTILQTVARMINGDSSTSATAGAASALPALPAGYMTINDLNGVPRKVPYYNI